MLLRRISQQGPESLEEWYADHPFSPEADTMMLALLNHLHFTPPNSTLWAHTSLNSIVLDTADDYRTGFGRISAAAGLYHLELRWFPQTLPTYTDLVWAQAHAQLIAQTPDLITAVQMVIGMAEHTLHQQLAPRTWFPALSVAPPDIHTSEQRTPLRTVSSYSGKPLAAFYQALSQDSIPDHVDYGRRMLRLIEHLETMTLAGEIWVYRQEETVVIVSQDRMMPGISIRAERSGFAFSCPWKTHIPAWESVTIKCYTQEVVDVCRLIQLAYSHRQHLH